MKFLTWIFNLMVNIFTLIFYFLAFKFHITFEKNIDIYEKYILNYGQLFFNLYLFKVSKHKILNSNC